MPTHAGDATFWIQIYDSEGNKGGQGEFIIHIDPRVLVTTQSAASGTTGVPYSLALNAVMKYGPAPEHTAPPFSPLGWTIMSGQLPPGLTFSATDGVISGTPTTVGSYPFSVKAANPDGRADTKALTIEVRAPLTIAPQTARRSEIGVPFQLRSRPRAAAAPTPGHSRAARFLAV